MNAPTTGAVVYFEVQADNPERAIEFYTSIFNWTFTPQPEAGWPYWTIAPTSTESEAAEVMGGLLKRPAETPPPEHGTNAYVCTMLVDDFDATEVSILSAGGIEAMPKMRLEQGGWQGYFVDTEGNTFGIRSG